MVENMAIHYLERDLNGNGKMAALNFLVINYCDYVLFSNYCTRNFCLNNVVKN